MYGPQTTLMADAREVFYNPIKPSTSMDDTVNNFIDSLELLLGKDPRDIPLEKVIRELIERNMVKL